MNKQTAVLLLLAGTILMLLVGIRAFRSTDHNPVFSTDNGGKTEAIGNGHSTEKSEETVVLRATVFGNTESLKAWNRLKTAYEIDHPNVRVTMKVLSEDEAYHTYKTQSWSGESSDLMLVDNEWVREFAARGWLSGRGGEVVSPDLSARLSPTVSEELTWNGYMWALPVTVDPYVLVWNREVLANEGMEPPNTYAALAKAAVSLRDAEKGRIGLYVPPDDPVALVAAAWALDWQSKGDANPVDDGAKKKSAGLAKSTDSSTQGQPAQTEQITPPKRLTGAEAWQHLQDGGIALMIVRSSDYLAHSDGTIEASALPIREIAGGKKASGWLHGLSLAVSAQSSHVSAALDCAAAFTAPSAQQTLAEAGKAMPADNEAYSLINDRNSLDFAAIVQAIDRSTAFEPGPDMMRRIEQAAAASEEWWKGSLDNQAYAQAIDDLRTTANPQADEVKDLNSASD